MKKAQTLSIIMLAVIVVPSLFTFAIARQSDESIPQNGHHVVLERTAQFMGRQMPPKLHHIWLTEDGMRIEFNREVTIYRPDLRKIWRFDSGAVKYDEYPLSDTIGFTQPKEAPTEYEWSFSSNSTDSLRHNLKIGKFRVYGVSEHSEIEGRLWFASDLPSWAARYSNAHLRPFWMLPRQPWSALVQSDTLFKTKFIVEVDWIAVQRRAESDDRFKLVRYERVVLPEWLFRPPKDATPAMENKEP